MSETPETKEREMAAPEYEYVFRLDYADETFEIVRVLADTWEEAKSLAYADPEVVLVTSLGSIDLRPQTALAFA